MPPAAFGFGTNKIRPNANSDSMFGRRGARSQVSPSFREAYPAAVEQTGEDYSGIMKGYKDLFSEASKRTSGGQDFRFNPIVPESFDYSRSAEVGEGFDKLRNLSETGGYTSDELASLRERGISPIRSIYANAQRNLDRNRVLSGGYGPNYGAVSAKMARDLSSQLSDVTTKVNADIAERVAAGRQAAIPQFAGLAERESETANRYGAGNVEARNRAAEINAARELETQKLNRESTDKLTSDRLEALRGMLSLYGTTPALASTFGNQAAQAASLESQATGQARRTGLELISQGMSGAAQPQPKIRQTTPLNRRSPLRLPLTGQAIGGFR